MVVVIADSLNLDCSCVEGAVVDCAGGCLGGCLGGVGQLFLTGIIVSAVFYLFTLHRAFEACSSKNCEMNPPYLVWLNFIPLFGSVWILVTVIKLANSIKKEHADLGIPGECSGGFGVGLVFAICTAICTACALIPPSIMAFPEGYSLLLIVGICALVCWITHWAQISGFRQTIEQHKEQAKENKTQAKGNKEQANESWIEERIPRE